MHKVIAFSLFGSSGKYIEGAIQNAIIAPHLYPDWQMRVYHDSTVPSTTIIKLRELGVVTIDKTGHFASPIFWRFLTNDDPDVDVWLSRDCDSRLNYRERCAVDQWLESGKGFHVIRDHPGHDLKFPILAGTFGCKKGMIENMESMIREFNKFDHWTDDQFFLNAYVLPLVENHMFEHSEFDRNGINLPTPYENFRYVGEPFEDGPVSSANEKYRRQLMDALRGPARLFHHVASVYDTKNHDEQRRNTTARMTWIRMKMKHPNFLSWELGDHLFHRSSRKFGDTKSVPFLKDVIEEGVKHARSDDDVIIFTNADNCLSQDALEAVESAIFQYTACVSQRYNYARIEPDSEWKKSAQDEGGQFLPGFDLFAFTVGWWKKYKDQVADMLIGYEAWDCMLECLVRWTGGIILPKPVVYHENHDQHWHRDRLTSPGQRYNLREFAFWAIRMGKYEEVKKTHSYSFEAIQQLEPTDFSAAMD